MRYQFIQQHQGQFRLTILLRTLGVCASAFYQWQKRPISQRAHQRAMLVAHIRALFEQSKGRYGSPRIHRDLRALGIRCSQKRVAQLMKEQNLVVRKPRKFVATTDSAHAFPVAQNLLNRQYQVEAMTRLNQVWAGDITYVPTAGCPLGRSWLHMAVVIDLKSRIECLLCGFRKKSSHTKALKTAAEIRRLVAAAPTRRETPNCEPGHDVPRAARIGVLA